MQAIVETVFDVVYLSTVVTLGVLMIKNAKSNKQYFLFGVMAIVLGLGDAFHLVPRMVALNTTGLENFVVSLGIGKFVTSITMTIFYIILYYVWRMRYNVTGKKGLTLSIYGLALIRIIISLFPQNAWTSAEASLAFGIYRNIPFAIMGLIIIALFYRSARESNDTPYKFMWLTIVLSFAFYIPVVLWADAYPLVGMLMIPKTCAYVWTVWIGFSDMRKRMKVV